MKIKCSPELSLTHEMALIRYLFVEFLFNKNECVGDANKKDVKTKQSNVNIMVRNLFVKALIK